MNAECTRTKLMFHGLGGRQVVGRFDGGEITSDGGGVLLREAEHRTRILGRLSQCLTDHRDPDRIEHSVEGLIKQRVLGLCLGYEDLNDHDELCRDRLLALLCDRDDLTGELRRVESDRGAAHGVVLELKRIVALLREAWPQVRITVRGDSGFCNDELMVWCEAEGIDYVLGRAKNARLKERIAREMAAARQLQQASGKAGRQFQELRYRTLESWSCERRVVAKVESLPRGENPRFIVTSVAVTEWEGRRLYEEVYCARGDMENRIKEQQLGLFADRTSSSQMQANQLRLYFSAFAYVMVQTLRRVGLVGTKLARAQCWTLRVKLLKIGAQIRVTTRKVWLSFSESYPYAALLRTVLARMQALPLRC